MFDWKTILKYTGFNLLLLLCLVVMMPTILPTCSSESEDTGEDEPIEGNISVTAPQKTDSAAATTTRTRYPPREKRVVPHMRIVRGHKRKKVK